MPAQDAPATAAEDADALDAAVAQVKAAGLRQTAMALLARREHSTREFAHKLRSRGYARAAVDAVTAAFTAQGWLSDDRFTETFVRACVGRGQGPIRIRAALRERGIDDATADAHVTEPAEFWLERAETARAKRFGPDLPADRPTWNRQARFLSQRGFPADLVFRVLGGSDT